MSLFELTADSSVIDVSFASDNSRIAVLHHTGVDFYAWDKQGSRPVAPTLLEHLEFPTSDGKGSPLQVALAGIDGIYVLRYEETMRLLYCNTSNTKAWSSVDVDSISSIGSSDSISSQITAQDLSGQVHVFAQLQKESTSVEFPTYLPWSQISSYDEEPVAFGLSKNGHLYANSRQLAKNCTSFVVTPFHLIFTTSNHFLKFVHLTGVDGMLSVA
jgi:elongator complex protein 1